MIAVGTQVLVTERLTLRPIRMDDAEDMFFNWASDPEVSRYLPWLPHPDLAETKTVIASWLEDLKKPEFFHWCIEYAGTAIGTIAVVSVDERRNFATLGYCLSRRFWNRGIMSEALLAVEEFLFLQAGFNRIEACHHVDNPASGRVMQKAGMRFEGVRRQVALDNQGVLIDLAGYAILRSDWDALCVALQ